MDRVADSTIRGFLYQFNMTLQVILQSASDEKIQIEGKIEDIDVINPDITTAIQCKYHASAENFKLSDIYKPVLQMMKHYKENSDNIHDANIKYVLYAYFPNIRLEDTPLITIADLETMLKTNNKEYICSYTSRLLKCHDTEITELINKGNKSAIEKQKITDYFNSSAYEIDFKITDFLENHFKFICGLSIEDVQKDVRSLLIENLPGSTNDDVIDIFYPNSIQKIAEISTIKDDASRMISKIDLLSSMVNVKETAITRWTRELLTYRGLLKAKRAQMKSRLNQNYRKRYWIFNSSELTDFDNEIVMFINDYMATYCVKPKLHYPVTMCIIDYDKEKLDNLQARLYQKRISTHDGYQGSCFFKDLFMKEPEKNMSKGWVEYKLRLCIGSNHVYEVFNQYKPDDLFLVTDKRPPVDYTDVNIELVEVNNFHELKYLLQMEGALR